MSADQKHSARLEPLTPESVAAAMHRPHLLVSFDDIDTWYRVHVLAGGFETEADAGKALLLALVDMAPHHSPLVKALNELEAEPGMQPAVQRLRHALGLI